MEIGNNLSSYRAYSVFFFKPGLLLIIFTVSMVKNLQQNSFDPNENYALSSANHPMKNNIPMLITNAPPSGN